MNFLPGNEASEQQRNYRTGYRDSMLKCGRVGMADEFERDPRLVSLPIRGGAGAGVGFLSAGSLWNLSALKPRPTQHRTGGGWGNGESVRVCLGRSRTIKTTKTKQTKPTN